jgi:EAL domain-containing protein (putative c-di-GMP-specific phosphodiesterase class I)
VLREACGQMAAWQLEGHRKLRISVNVSTVQLSKTDFAESVQAILRDTKLDPSTLTLEVTETAMMRDMGEARAQILRLRAIGIAVALDDFGTGYSSLSSLHLLPVDYIKIDRSFIERMGEQEGGSAVVEAMIGLVHQCGFEVVAEGVESAQQLGDLKVAGADFVQGFLLGRPQLADGTQLLLNTNEEFARQ